PPRRGGGEVFAVPPATLLAWHRRSRPAVAQPQRAKSIMASRSRRGGSTPGSFARRRTCSTGTGLLAAAGNHLLTSHRCTASTDLRPRRVSSRPVSGHGHCGLLPVASASRSPGGDLVEADLVGGMSLDKPSQHGET